MATIKSYTSVEQSKKLTKILPIESADSHYVRNTHDFMGNPVDGKWSHPKYGNPDSKFAHYIVQNFSNYEIIPCWSLAALLEVLPNNKTVVTTVSRGGWQMDPIDYLPNIWWCEYEDNESCTIFSAKADNAVDACYEMIIKLHKEGLL